MLVSAKVVYVYDLGTCFNYSQLHCLIAEGAALK